MKDYEFVVVLAGEIDEARISDLYGAIDDGTFITTCGVSQVHFQREAASLDAALGSAIKDVERAGMSIEKIELQPEVAAYAQEGHHSESRMADR